MNDLTPLSNVAGHNDTSVPCRKRFGPLRGGVCLAACVLLAGCASPVFQNLGFSPPYHPDNVFLYVPGLAPDVKRVAVLPLACDGQRVDLSDGCEMLNPVLKFELIKAKKFEIVSVSPDILRSRTGRATWTGAEMLPPDLFETLRQLYGCDAILFCQLTAFRAYAPLAVGWRMKLVDARTRQTLWAADEVFDAGEPAVHAGASYYESDELRIPRHKPENWLVLNSPRQFGQYSAAQLLATLPTR
jgi:hypothetical protein